MAPWIIPALKAVLPHVGTIVAAAKPMFSKPQPGQGDGTQDEQIAELQAVAAQNDANIRELAAQFQQTVAALEQAAAQAHAQSQHMQRLCWIAVGSAAVSLVIALAALLGN